MNDLAIPKTLTDYCEIRENVLAKVKRAYDTLLDAEAELKTIYDYGLPAEALPRFHYDNARKAMDQILWRQAFDKTGFMQLMDAEAKKRFMEDVDSDPPVFSEDNIRATFLTLAQEADTMFARGLVNVFLRLSDDHKTNTNSPFKVNERAILSGMMRIHFPRGLVVNYSRWASELLNDLDRVIKTLDEKKHTPRSLEIAINSSMRDDNLYEDEYYQIRGYRNSNMHIRFKRLDLLEKANKIVGDYYHGNALAESATS